MGCDLPRHRAGHLKYLNEGNCIPRAIAPHYNRLRLLHDSTIHDGREIIPVIKSSEEMIRIFNINI